MRKLDLYFYDVLRGVTNQRPCEIFTDTAYFLVIILVLISNMPCRKSEASKNDGFIIGHIAYVIFAVDRTVDYNLNTIRERDRVVSLTETLAKRLPNAHVFITIPLYSQLTMLNLAL